MADTERRQLATDKDPFYDHDGRVKETWADERYVSHSKPCWMCGKGAEARRRQRSKPRRVEGKRAILDGLNDD